MTLTSLICCHNGKVKLGCHKKLCRPQHTHTHIIYIFRALLLCRLFPTIRRLSHFRSKRNRHKLWQRAANFYGFRIGRQYRIIAFIIVNVMEKSEPRLCRKSINPFALQLLIHCNPQTSLSPAPSPSLACALREVESGSKSAASCHSDLL